MELLINIYAHFTSHAGHLKGHHVKLYDRDLLSDDFLQEQELRSDGKVHFQIDPAAYRDAELIREMDPDFYMVVLHNGEEIFRTPVANNIKLDKEAYFNAQEGLAVDLGTFLISSS